MSQTVLITGASRGLGLGLVKQFLSHGYRVIATCRNPSQATDLCEALKNANQSPPLALDVASDESVESLRDFLVSNQLEVNHLGNLRYLPGGGVGEISVMLNGVPFIISCTSKFARLCKQMSMPMKFIKMQLYLYQQTSRQGKKDC